MRKRPHVQLHSRALACPAGRILGLPCTRRSSSIRKRSRASAVAWSCNSAPGSWIRWQNSAVPGRYLIHVLEPNAELAQSAQARLRATGHYGMAWVEQFGDSDHLPYAENLVNLILIRDFTVPADELARVLAPGGTLAVANRELVTRTLLENAGFVSFREVDGILVARKPWPGGMDVWSHPRHAADGNAVSATRWSVRRSESVGSPPPRRKSKEWSRPAAAISTAGSWLATASTDCGCGIAI